MTLARRAKRRDTTEKAIIAALRTVGAQVIQCDAFDLLVIHRGHVHMLECKTGKEPLTARQERLLADGWPLHIVRDVEQALRAVGAKE